MVLEKKKENPFSPPSLSACLAQHQQPASIPLSLTTLTRWQAGPACQLLLPPTAPPSLSAAESHRNRTRFPHSHCWRSLSIKFNRQLNMEKDQYAPNI